MREPQVAMSSLACASWPATADWECGQGFLKEDDTKAQSHFQVLPLSFSREHHTPQSTVTVTEISLYEMGAPFKTTKCKQMTSMVLT